MQLTPINKIKKKQIFIFYQPKDYKIKNTNLTYKRFENEK